MRLLHFQSNHISLVECLGEDIPRYGILSHTWASDIDEVTLKDITDGATLEDITDSIGRKAGYKKILFCAKQAAKDGLQYFWVDTCCIDKSSSAELSEAINSMFRWYQEAVKCYVYLSDVSIEDRQSFQASRWFTRGWTLQELVAPKVIAFYTVEGEPIGDKSSWLQEIEHITRIPQRVLQGGVLLETSVEERLSWAKTRSTKREEDLAYSLLGIFDIQMPLLYGEGRRKAFFRLREEISRSLSETELMIESRQIDPGGVLPAPYLKSSAHISGRTGNIRVGGRAGNVNTGISLKHFTLESPFSARISRQTGSVEVGFDSSDINTGVIIR